MGAHRKDVVVKNRFVLTCLAGLLSGVAIGLGYRLDGWFGLLMALCFVVVAWLWIATFSKLRG